MASLEQSEGLQEDAAHDSPVVSDALMPFKVEIKGIVVESTFNRYGLVDFLTDSEYRDHLANPCGMGPYKGLE